MNEKRILLSPEALAVWQDGAVKSVVAAREYYKLSLQDKTHPEWESRYMAVESLIAEANLALARFESMLGIKIDSLTRVEDGWLIQPQRRQRRRKTKK